MNQPLVSVIVPCYKVEQYLDRCLESLVNQTLYDIEIILVDDRSPDNTPALCDQWAAKDDRIKVIHKPVNEGLGMARNTGIDQAIGEYIMCLDSDDTYELDACEKLYGNAKEHDADVVTGNFITEIKPGVWIESHELERIVILDKESIRNYALDVIASAPHVKSDRLHPVSVCLLCMRRSIINNNSLRFYSEREIASEDTLFKIAFLNCCNKMVCLDYPFYHYYHNVASLSHSFKESAFESLKKLRSKMIEIINDEDALLRINRFIISDIRMHITRLVNSSQKNKIEIIKKILNDPIWQELSSFQPSYYGLYARWFYELCLLNMPHILFVYMTSVAKMRKLSKNR